MRRGREFEIYQPVLWMAMSMINGSFEWSQSFLIFDWPSNKDLEISERPVSMMFHRRPLCECSKQSSGQGFRIELDMTSLSCRYCTN